MKGIFSRSTHCAYTSVYLYVGSPSLAVVHPIVVHAITRQCGPRSKDLEILGRTPQVMVLSTRVIVRVTSHKGLIDTRISTL